MMAGAIQAKVWSSARFYVLRNNYLKGENMPRNKRESLIFTVMMCFVMVLTMSIYNISLHRGSLSFEIIKEAWLSCSLCFCYVL